MRDTRALAPAMADKLRKLLLALETADDLNQVSRFPGWKLHPLKVGTNTASEIDWVDYH